MLFMTFPSAFSSATLPSHISTSLLKLKLNLEGQGKQPPTDQPQPPAASHQPPAVCRQPPSHLKAELSCFEFVYK
jgi:hypothetical protein